MHPFTCRHTASRHLLALIVLLCGVSEGVDAQEIRDGRITAFTALPHHPSPSTAAADTSIDPWDNEKWRGGFGMPGPESVVLTMANGDDDVYIGGLFSSISGLPFNGVARWDGRTYNPLGEGYWAGVDGVVYALLVDGDDVYVGGQFSMAGGTKMRNIGVYNRRTNRWSPLGEGIGGIRGSSVLCMEMIDGQLYVGGRFVVCGTTVAVNIARWDGTRWHRVGTGANNHVNTLVAHDGKLYAGGDFTIAGDVPVGKVAWFDPETDAWHDLGAGIENSYQTVMAMEVDDDYVYIGGRFDSVAGMRVNHVARWNKGTKTWSPLANGVLNHNKTVGLAGAMAADGVGPVRIRAMELRGTDLFVGGDFDSIPSKSATNDRGSVPADMAIWRTSTEEWSTLTRTSALTGYTWEASGVYRVAPPPVTGGITPVADQSTVVYDFATGDDDEIYIGGDFDFAGPKNLLGTGGDLESVFAPNICRLSQKDTLWSAVGAAGPDSSIHAMVRDGEEIYVAGTFLRAGDTIVRGISRLDKTNGTWSALDGGLMMRGFNSLYPGHANRLIRHDDYLYVSGVFNETAGGLVTGSLARWNVVTEEWERVGDSIFTTIFDIAVADGAIHAVGVTPLGGACIATWDGSSWRTKPFDMTGVVQESGAPGIIRAIAVIGDSVFIAGRFDSAAGIPANSIVIWNRVTDRWSEPNHGIRGDVHVLEVIDGRLHAGGQFSIAGNRVIPCAAIWNADSALWEAVGAGFSTVSDNIVTSFHKAKYGLYVGGQFISYGDGASTNRASSITMWDGERWRTLGSGLGSGVSVRLGQPSLNAMVSDDSTLFIGGNFVYVGAKRAQYYGEWRFPKTLEGGTDEIGESPSGTIASTPPTPESAAIDNPDDDYWDERFSPQNLPAGLSDEAFAIAGDDTELFVGGAFENVVGIPANGLARWDGVDWTPLDDGTDVGVDGYVYALALDGDDLYVGGQFTAAGGIPARNIAVWNRATRRWRALGDGIGGAVPFISAIELHDGQLYVGGNFEQAGSSTARNIARWDGSAWHPLGSGVDGNVDALETFQGRLYVGGSFAHAGDSTSTGIAYWDGTTWHGFSNGINGVVNDLLAQEDRLLVGGRFTFRYCADPPDCTYDREIANIMAITGDPSTLIGEEVAGDGKWATEIRDILVTGNSLYLAGSFFYRPPAGFGTPSLLKNVAQITDGFWIHNEEGTNAPANALASFRGRVIAGGAFSQAGQVRADHVAEWNPLYRRWRPLASGFTLGLVTALTLKDGSIYAAGPFCYKDDPYQILDEDNHLALLGAHGWHVQKGAIKGFAVTAASTADEILVGGSFITADDIIGVNICRWDPESKIWRALTPGSGVADQLDLTYVSAITTSASDIYVGGIFGVVDTFETPNVTAYDRTTGIWRPLGDGLDKQVWALLLTPDGTLYAGGDFRRSGTRSMSGVARWDGTAWQPLGDGVDGSVRSLAWGNDRLYVGGIFTDAGGVTTDNIAAWDPVTGEWSALGDGLGTDFLPSVDVLTFTHGMLFAGGFFQNSGPQEMSNIARWDGRSWQSLGSGVDHAVYAMVAQQNDIYVAGGFRTAGRKPSPNVALWHDPTLTIAPSEPAAAGAALLAGPNPFAERTIVSYSVPRRAPVRIGIHDLRGVEIARLVDRVVDAGEYRVTWDAVDALPPGIYVCRMDYEATVTTRKIVRR